ncbi:MAG TPA: DoxX family protein [Thermoplasmata archaeon]|nr:DoxX family protein [Thermoplasmata archaeon]
MFVQVRLDTWIVRNVSVLKRGLAIVFGVLWLIDGTLKFTSGFVASFPGAVQNAGANAPGWLSGWYSFWYAQANANSAAIVDTVGIVELALGAALVLGFLRKIAYTGGIVLSLLIWAVPEGFGGPYSFGSGGTDAGTGVVYALMFVGLIVINATFGPSRWTVDALLEKRWAGWTRLAEIRGPWVRAAAPAGSPPVP